MKVPFPVLLLAAELSGVAAQKVVHFDLQRHAHPVDKRVVRRDKVVLAPLGNAQVLYYANVSVGTPPQDLQLQVDTGSSDVWMSWSHATLCEEAAYGMCQGGDFSPSDSSTFNVVSQHGFKIQYVDGSSSSGAYFTDELHIGSITVQNQVMGLAEQTSIGTGILGIGFALDEAVCTGYTSNCDTYTSIVEQLVKQGFINSQAYSLWLNDLDAGDGSLLFGGVDTDKYVGDLVLLPIQPDAQSHTYTSMTVALTGFQLATSKGNRPINFGSEAVAAILDSGTSLTYLPTALAKQIFAEAGASYSSSLQAYILPCDSRSISSTLNPTFNFQFGGSSGPVIKVSWGELIIDIFNNDGSQPTYSDGRTVCQFGIMPAGDQPVLLGDTFLRSAYVVYDLSNLQVALAQTDFNATSSNVQEIKAGSGGIPNVASTASGVSAKQTATGNIQPGVVQSTVSGKGPVSTSPPLAQLTQASGAAGITVPGSDFAGVLVLGIASLSALLGSCLVFL